ncbi:hypothetical protein DFH09DRAFT_1092787 [Mycena vulgaris]|nr:hypothetical protein DFH09DRAFT_1092787 [Mycena vulgaris]
MKYSARPGLRPGIKFRVRFLSVIWYNIFYPTKRETEDFDTTDSTLGGCVLLRDEDTLACESLFFGFTVHTAGIFRLMNWPTLEYKNQHPKIQKLIGRPYAWAVQRDVNSEKWIVGIVAVICCDIHASEYPAPRGLGRRYKHSNLADLLVIKSWRLSGVCGIPYLTVGDSGNALAASPYLIRHRSEIKLCEGSYPHTSCLPANRTQPPCWRERASGHINSHFWRSRGTCCTPDIGRGEAGEELVGLRGFDTMLRRGPRRHADRRARRGVRVLREFSLPRTLGLVAADEGILDVAPGAQGTAEDKDSEGFVVRGRLQAHDRLCDEENILEGRVRDGEGLPGGRRRGGRSVGSGVVGDGLLHTESYTKGGDVEAHMDYLGDEASRSDCEVTKGGMEQSTVWAETSCWPLVGRDGIRTCVSWPPSLADAPRAAATMMAQEINQPEEPDQEDLLDIGSTCTSLTTDFTLRNCAIPQIRANQRAAWCTSESAAH